MKKNLAPKKRNNIISIKAYSGMTRNKPFVPNGSGFHHALICLVTGRFKTVS